MIERIKIVKRNGDVIYTYRYDCKEEYCPYTAGAPIKRWPGQVERSYNERSKTCMFANGLPPGRCAHSDNKEKDKVQKSLEDFA